MMAALVTEAIGEIPIVRACSLLSLGRAEYYRLKCHEDSAEEDLELREQIQEVALRWPMYGYRRITKELARQGTVVNHKRVLRLMRADNLLCFRKKRFVTTTDSVHPFPYYPNLVPDLDVSDIDQLWVADITYIRVLSEFIYLAVVLDAYSRRCVGWALGRTLSANLAIAALEVAFAKRKVGPGLVHHSDRGVQYASLAYTGMLRRRGIRISMSRRGNPYDNAQAERFMRTLKQEEVYLFEYESLEEAEKRITTFLDEVYNQKRLHSAIGYVPPVEFEKSLKTHGA